MPQEKLFSNLPTVYTDATNFGPFPLGTVTEIQVWNGSAYVQLWRGGQGQTSYRGEETVLVPGYIKPYIGASGAQLRSVSAAQPASARVTVYLPVDGPYVTPVSVDAGATVNLTPGGDIINVQPTPIDVNVDNVVTVVSSGLAGTPRVVTTPDPGVGVSTVTFYTVPAGKTAFVHSVEFILACDATVGFRNSWVILTDSTPDILTFGAGPEGAATQTIRGSFNDHQGGTLDSFTVVTTTGPENVWAVARVIPPTRLLASYQAQVFVDNMAAGDAITGIIAYVEEF